MGLEQDKYMVDASKDTLKYAFESKFAGRGAAEKVVDIQAKYKEILQKPSDGCVIYTHIPFCQSKCSFCGFAGSKVNKEEGKKYISALINEIKIISQYPYARQTPVRAVYLGGGTPSAIEPEYLALLSEAFRKNFNLANDCEITLEGRTHDFEGSRGKELIEAGFNRLSLGVQTFDTGIRRSLGRMSEKDRAVKILSELVSYNKAAVIIDLIYGLPGQSVEMFVEDLKTAESTGIDGLDTYQLIVFENSMLKKAVLAGSVPETAPIDNQGAFYKAAYDYLTYNHWRQLSLNHYGRTSRERNIYNPWVKRKAGCIAIGAGAGGSIGGWSYYRSPAPQRYIENIEAGNIAPDSLTMPGANEALINKVTEHMEKGYLNIDEISALKNSAAERLMPYIENWSAACLAELNGKYMNLTAAGKFWGVNLTKAVTDILTREI
jgi:oxygen-independent coproporphyrinogen-3 oxidase